MLHKKEFRLILTNINSAKMNMAIDKALTISYQKDDIPILRFYTWENSFTVGLGQDLEHYSDLKEIYKERFEKIFPKIDFGKLIKETKCSYCGINITQIQLLGKNGKLNNKRSDTRGYSLEIDRKLPNLEYSKNNCCMACYWCNNAKTDEYSPKEFKPIAKGINQSWNIKIKKSGQLYKKVVFPEKSKIWNIDFGTRIKEN
mgnify:CR=1 FL=1